MNRRSGGGPLVDVLVIGASVLLVLSWGCARKASGPPAGTAPSGHTAGYNSERNAYFGDLHVHTMYSFDAFVFGTRATPDDAYRYGKGGAIDHPSGYQIQLKGGPLDFEAVTDHAEYLGIVPAMADTSTEISKLPMAKKFQNIETPEQSREAFQALVTMYRSPDAKKALDLDVVRSAWERTKEAAERNYEPGRFTTFIAYEYTSAPDSQNLHRNVIFRGSAAPDLPFSALDSDNPEDLWRWMESNRAKGMEALAIPHNSNGSNGQMFRLETFNGEALDASYAAERMRNEPVVEVSQTKGTSEVHPLLSPNDEWADFEIFPFRIATTLPSDPHGSYVREAYKNGLVLEETKGFNPFKFGLIGSTDTHNGGGTMEEYNYHSKVGILDGTPERRGSVPVGTNRDGTPKYAEGYYQLWGASGLAGVWAEENTRDSIFAALQRKEVFATSGPRMRVRFFASFDYPDDLLSKEDMIAEAYEKGTPMGGDLAAMGNHAPRFLVWATRDPNDAPLQRLQIIKGWMENGEAKEQVFDVACSDGAQPDATTYRCPDNGAAVNLTDCSYSQDVGAAELQTLWTDPVFKPGQRAFYYVRVLQDPTCRWSTWDAVRAGVAPREGLPKTIQERAWSSPIWYVP